MHTFVTKKQTHVKDKDCKVRPAIKIKMNWEQREKNNEHKYQHIQLNTNFSKRKEFLKEYKIKEINWKLNKIMGVREYEEYNFLNTEFLKFISNLLLIKMMLMKMIATKSKR